MMTLNSFTDEQIKTLMRPSIKSKNGNTADMREEIMFNSPSFRKNVSRTHPFRQELHEAVRSQMRPMVAAGLHNFTGEDQTLEIRKTKKTKGYDFDIYLNNELQQEKLEHKLSKPKKFSKGVYYDVPQMMNFQLNKGLFSEVLRGTERYLLRELRMGTISASRKQALRINGRDSHKTRVLRSMWSNRVIREGDVSFHQRDSHHPQTEEHQLD